MHPYQKFPRPESPYYETRFPHLSQGDIFEDVPFGTLGPELRYIDNPLEVLHPILPQRGMILSPTCDFRRPSAEQLATDPSLNPYALQEFVVMAPVLSLASVAETWGAKRMTNLGLLRKYDALRRYMYLPPLPTEGLDEDWVVDITCPDRIAIGLLLRQPSARLTQLTFAAVQQLQYKVVLAATSRFVDRSVFEPPMN